MNIIYLCSQSYIRQTLVSIQSVLNTYQGFDNLQFYVFSPDKFTEQDHQITNKVCNKISLITVTNYASQFKEQHSEFAQYFSDYSDIAFLKMYVPDYMEEHNIYEGCYIDVDTVMIDKIDEPYANIDNYAIQAVQYSSYKAMHMNNLLQYKFRELSCVPSNYGRINDGVLFINTKKIMELKYKEIREWLLSEQSNKLTTHLDVDVYSYFFLLNYEKCCSISEKYNKHYKFRKSDISYEESPAIIHFVSINPWCNPSYPYSNTWYKHYYQIKAILDTYEK